ncbi:unnamed protein product [Mucor hiemalis]
MDNELKSLILKYKQCLEQLSEMNRKVEKVNSSERVVANHLTKSQESNSPTPSVSDTTTNSVDEEKSNSKLNELLTKLRVDVDTALHRRTTDVSTSKQAVNTYIDNTIWNLFSRTELQNKSLLFHNDPNRRIDKNRLMKLMTTLIEIDKSEDKSREIDGEDIFYDQLHEWMVNIFTIYLNICTDLDKRGILQLLTTTSHIWSWAIPLIQFNDLKEIDEYIEILDMIFKSTTSWTEDDYLAVLDQLAIDYTYNKLVIEPPNLKPDDANENMKLIFNQTQRLSESLSRGLETLSNMDSVVKRISQTLIQISNILVEVASTEQNTQDGIDVFISHLVLKFYNRKQNGWFFLPNIPFKALSTDTLWNVTTQLLKIKSTAKPTSLDQVLNEHSPNITRFQYELMENQTQGFFMLSCLTNIATCIPSGVDKVTSIDNGSNTLSACIITIISYTLFNVAFVDKTLREVFYKDVRDNLELLCDLHPFIISLLFRWTVQHISVMERMALYLFRSLKLDNWIILNDDLKLLHKLLSQQQSSTTSTINSQQTAQLQLAKYIIEHLNYGYNSDLIDHSVSKSQPWHNRKTPFLSYDTHEEIAFILLDACQKFQPLPETPQNENKGAIELMGTVTSAVSTYLPIADQVLLLKSTYSTPTVANEFIQWAWSVAIRLKLYDCPVSSRATDIEKSITLPFLKLVLNSYNDVSSSHSALLIYISFMLSVTSRHFLRFESNNGWMKLLVVLKRGKAEAVVQIFSEIIPSFVYMHGDDFFNDESLVDFFKHMVELKSDPMLIKAVANTKTSFITTGVGVIIASHIWQAHLIDSVSNLLDEHGQGFSYVDLVIHSWLKTVFRKPDWMWHSGYVQVVDHLCRLAFTLGRYKLVHSMLTEEHKQLEAAKLQGANSSPRLTRFIKNMIPVGEAGYSTLLIGEWSMLNVKANTFNKTPGIENQMHWFAFDALVMETVMEQDPYREEIIQLISKQLSTALSSDPQPSISSVDLNTLYKSTSQKKPLEFFAIYRWVQHILVLPVEHVLLPLYLQMFFSLYYQRIESTQKITLGFIFFNKKSEVVTKLRDHIASVQTYYGQKIGYDTQNENTTQTPGDTVVTAEVLQQTYYAMWLWLGNEDLLTMNTDIHNLPSHYNVKRLELCYGKLEAEQPWHNEELYWTDLIDKELLEQDFLNHQWEGSEKFRTGDDYNDRKKCVDSITLSTINRKQKLITGKETIAPLPPLIINTPTI